MLWTLVHSVGCRLGLCDVYVKFIPHGWKDMCGNKPTVRFWTNSIRLDMSLWKQARSSIHQKHFKKKSPDILKL